MGLNVSGFKELNDALNKLDVKTGVKTLRKAGRNAMKPVLDHQQANVKVDSGDTKAALTMSARVGGRKNKRRAVLISVGPTKKTAGRGDKKRNLSGVNQKAIAQEYGNVKTKAKPFIRPSLELNQQKIIDTLTSEFKRLLESK